MLSSVTETSFISDSSKLDLHFLFNSQYLSIPIREYLEPESSNPTSLEMGLFLHNNFILTPYNFSAVLFVPFLNVCNLFLNWLFIFLTFIVCTTFALEDFFLFLRLM